MLKGVQRNPPSTIISHHDNLPPSWTARTICATQCWQWKCYFFRENDFQLYLEGDGVGVEKLSLYIIHEHDWKDVITQTVEIKNLLTFPIFSVVFTRKLLFLPH